MGKSLLVVTRSARVQFVDKADLNSIESIWCPKCIWQ